MSFRPHGHSNVLPYELQISLTRANLQGALNLYGVLINYEYMVSIIDGHGYCRSAQLKLICKGLCTSRLCYHLQAYGVCYFCDTDIADQLDSS